VFDFVGSPVPVRPDLRYAYIAAWNHLSRPGPTLTARSRIELLGATRRGEATSASRMVGMGQTLGELADSLYHRPKDVDETLVRAAADAEGDPTAVEVIAIVSILSAIDGTHRGLGADLEPLPEPIVGPPTGVITEGLKRRRLHVPAPPGPIPFTLDLLPDEGAAFQALFGPQYMTGWEMALDTFFREPGLNRAQIEVVSSRTSFHNECFY